VAAERIPYVRLDLEAVGARGPAMVRTIPWSPCIVALAAMIVVGDASAQRTAARDYPARFIRIIVPYAAGAGPDMVGRTLAEKMTIGLGQNIVFENRGGGGGVPGTDMVAKAAPDGYTLLLQTANYASYPVFYKNLPYDPAKDLLPVSLLARTVGFVLVVNPSLPAKNIKELIALAKGKPGEVFYSSSGQGSGQHLSMEMFAQMTGTKLTHVPYKGTGQSVTDLMAGQIHFVFASMPVVFPHMKTGRLRTLASTGSKRTPLAPDLPTVAEAGIPGYAFDSWWGLVTNAAVPPAIINTLNTEVRRALQLPDVKERFVRTLERGIA
jgi:tripartite-type tricarboxylate transporter receptor subunit TctC